MSIATLYDNSGCLVTITGKFTFEDNPVFREIIRAIAEKNLSMLALDMTETDFVDSAALGMLLLARDTANTHQKKMVIRGIRGQVKKMFELAHFEQLFTITY